IVSLSYYKKGAGPKAAKNIERTEPVEEIKKSGKISKISLNEKSGYYILAFTGKNLPKPKLIKDEKRIILLFFKTVTEKIDDTILFYRGPLTLARIHRADNSVRIVLAIESDSKYELQKINDEKVIIKFPRKERERPKKIAEPVLLETIKSNSDEVMGDSFVITGKNLKKLELSRAMNQIILKGQNVVHFIKKKSKIFQDYKYMDFYRLVQSGNDVRLIIGLKNFDVKDKIKYDVDDKTLKITLQGLPESTVEKQPVIKTPPISPTVKHITVQRTEQGKQIVIELDKMRKFEVFRPHKNLILSIIGGNLDKDVDLVPVTDDLFTGYRLLKSVEGVKLILIFREPVESVYYSADNLIRIKYGKKKTEVKKKDSLKNLISKLSYKKKVVEKELVKTENIQSIDVIKQKRLSHISYLEKIKYFKNTDSRELVFLLSKPVRYRIVRGKKQIIINLKAESLLKENTHFIYDDPVNFIRISRQDELLRMVVVLSRQVDPEIISVEDGILLKFPVISKTDHTKLEALEKSVKATQISLPYDAAPKSRKNQSEYLNVVDYADIEDESYSIDKISQSLKIIIRKKKAEELYKSAVAEMKREEYGKAYDNLTAALEFLPENEKILKLVNQIRPLYRVHQYQTQGIKFSKAGDWTQASFAFREALNIDPDNIKAKYLLSEAVKMKELNDQFYRAKVFFQNARYVDAKKILKMILEVKGDLKKGIILFGKCFELENRFDEALAQYEIGLKYYPVDMDLRRLSNAVKIKRKIKELYTEGRAYEKNQEWDKALFKYEEGVELKRDLELNSSEQSSELIKKGYMAYLRRELDIALVSFKKVIALDWENIKAHYWLGKIYMDKGEISLATAEFKIVSRLDPDNNVSLIDFVKNAQDDTDVDLKIISEDTEAEVLLILNEKMDFKIADGSSYSMILKETGADYALIEIFGKISKARLEMNLSQLYDLNDNKKNDTGIKLIEIIGDNAKIKMMYLVEKVEKIHTDDDSISKDDKKIPESTKNIATEKLKEKQNPDALPGLPALKIGE
ncbi:hypothetical protein KAJ27_25650, partial [bacterium]|nr:hypothetical protein [bacterium]